MLSLSLSLSLTLSLSLFVLPRAQDLGNDSLLYSKSKAD